MKEPHRDRLPHQLVRKRWCARRPLPHRPQPGKPSSFRRNYPGSAAAWDSSGASSMMCSGTMSKQCKPAPPGAVSAGRRRQQRRQVNLGPHNCIPRIQHSVVPRRSELRSVFQNPPQRLERAATAADRNVCEDRPSIRALRTRGCRRRPQRVKINFVDSHSEIMHWSVSRLQRCRLRCVPPDSTCVAHCIRRGFRLNSH